MVGQHRGRDEAGAEARSTDSSAPRPRASRRTGRLLFAAGVPLGLLGAGALVWQASYAAFSSTTVNPGNTFTAGSVVLTDNDSGTAVFTTAALKPGDSGSSCITVTYSGSLTPSAPVQLYVASGDATDTPGSGGGALSTALDFSVETATGSGIFGSGAPCTALSGTAIFGSAANTTITAGAMLSDFVAKNAYSSGGTTSVSSAWTPTGGSSTTKVFRFNYALATDAPNTAQGAVATVKLTWESRS
ncbi:MAG: hypothetical protein JWN95_866 [Frankiales bacterium]|nr:hypothetical protein [Frankiales bacterium]